ncbi:hypothetical protein cypCar_00043141 [Cyprinus carpio]|nr:hypothetical protein cypCar_00043141 [Cyprinus carpio]
MLDLYNTIADVDGVTKDPTLLEGNTVRSFFDKLHMTNRVLFNMSSVAKSEKILNGRASSVQAQTTSVAHDSTDITSVSSKKNVSQGKKLLSSRLVPITPAAGRFSPSLKLTLAGLQMDMKTVRSIGRNHHHSKQPMLVSSPTTGRRAASLEITLKNMRPTNHATVQSIIQRPQTDQSIKTPCCVPDKLFSINLLYFDDDENVVLKQI